MMPFQSRRGATMWTWRSSWRSIRLTTKWNMAKGRTFAVELIKKLGLRDVFKAIQLAGEKLSGLWTRWRGDQCLLMSFDFPVLKLKQRGGSATSQKQHFRPKFQNSENTFQYKLPPKTWEKSPQKPLLATQKCFFGHFTYNKNFYVKFSLCLCSGFWWYSDRYLRK